MAEKQNITFYGAYNVESHPKTNSGQVVGLNDLVNELNVDKLYPLGSGYYTLSTAIAAILDATLKKTGVKITFQSAAGIFETWQFKSSVANWSTTTNWEKLPTRIELDINTSDIAELKTELGLDYYGCYYNTPECDGIREGNINLHRTLPIHNLLHGCILDDNGNETYRMPDGSWLGQERSGANGQVMIAIPNYYFKCTSDSGVIRFLILNKAPKKGVKYDGFGWSQFFDNNIEYVYCSAYEASLDRTSGKLASVINPAAQFRGGTNESSWDNTYRSLLGRPITGFNRTQFRNAARLRNTNNTRWNEYLYTVNVMISWLFYVEYATLNSQKPYNPALDANGFKQGGLGTGVSEFGTWGDFNGYQPFIPCGISDILGNGSGVVTYNVLSSDGSTTYAAPVPRYRGVENIFGHIWKWCDGLNITEDGTTRQAFVTTNPDFINDDNVNSYENRGIMSHSGGWITAMILGTYADLIPSSVGGSSSTYFADYYWLSTDSGLWGALLGGRADLGSIDGLAYVNSNIRFASADAGIGSRLCFV